MMLGLGVSSPRLHTTTCVHDTSLSLIVVTKLSLREIVGVFEGQQRLAIKTH